MTLHENIKNCIFDHNAFLFEEPSNLLKQELREPQTYNAIIAAIATGSSKLNEIASKVQIESSLCVIYLSNLISLGIIEKEIPVTEKIGKKTIYLISDNLFRFWYRFVPVNMAAIASGRIKTSYHQSVEPFITVHAIPRLRDAASSDASIRPNTHPQVRRVPRGCGLRACSLHRGQS